MSEGGETPSEIGGYEILSKLSSGGMGDVLLARRRGAYGFEKLVAIKTMRGELRGAEDMRRMFLDEARLVARLSHPAIAQVYDFGEDGDTLYLAMEHVSGIAFSRLAARRPPAAVVVRAMAEALRGLHTAHEVTDINGAPLGVVHRDVSPQNLMLTFEGHVKILDFGIALMRDRQAPATELGQIRGKPAYMSPEQVKGERIDRRTDIFAAAIVLYELLTGERLFVGDSLYAVAMAVSDAPISSPSALAGPFPPRLDEIVLRGLERDPETRFQTALSFAEELDRLAPEVGAETPESYALNELSQERSAHQDNLQRILSEPGRKIPFGRPAGLSTTPAGEVPRPSERLSTVQIVATMRRRWRYWAVAAAVGVLALGAWAGAHLLGDGQSEILPAPPPAATPIAGTPAPGGIESEKPADTVEDPRVTRPGKRQKTKTALAHRAPPPAPPRPPAQPNAFGFLTVGANPYALVRIDGKEIGTTPIVRHRVPVGEHELVLVTPDGGAVRLRHSVTVKEGGHEQVVAP